VAPVYATNRTLNWVSSNEAAATVVDGVVTPIAEGLTTITVSTQDGSNLTATCVVTVSLQPGNLQGKIVREYSEAIAGINIFLYDSQNTQVAQTTTTEQGSFSFVDISSGTYSIKTEKLDSYLAGGTTDVNITPGQATVVPDVCLYFGDLNNDNRIDMNDLVRISKNFGEVGK